MESVYNLKGKRENGLNAVTHKFKLKHVIVYIIKQLLLLI